MKKIIVLFLACLFLLCSCDVFGLPETTTTPVATARTSDVTTPATPTTAPKEVCTVTFDSRGGSFVEQQVVEKGEKAKEPAAPTKECRCEFDGWYAGAEKWSFIGYVVTEDITLTAKWIDCFGLNEAEIEILEGFVSTWGYTWRDIEDIRRGDYYNENFDGNLVLNENLLEYKVTFKNGKTKTGCIAKEYVED